MAGLRVVVVANAEQFGGGELDVCMHMRMFLEEGCEVEFRPATPPPICPDIPIPEGVRIGPPLGAAPIPESDALFFLANNAVMPERLARARSAWIQAARASAWRFMLLNWQIRDAAQPWFAGLWDRVGFLCSTLRDEWRAATGHELERTFVHPPAVDLAPYLDIPRDYAPPVTFIRHSVAAKWPADTPEIASWISRGCPGARFDVMGMPAGMVPAIAQIAPLRWQPAFNESRFEFLRRGNCYWYPLRYGYTDQGPRTIVEAMASGLAVIADNRDGAKDRITPETGWLCDRHEDYERVAREIAADPEILRRKGEAARSRAFLHFQPQAWVDAILGTEGDEEEAA